MSVMATSTVSPNEVANRTRLVADVLDFLASSSYEWDVEALEALDEDVAGGWDRLAEAMGRERPFSPATRAQILGTARIREADAAAVVDDPFAGLGSHPGVIR